MSVVTVLFFLLAAYFPFPAICAPGGHADNLAKSVSYLDEFEHSALSVIEQARSTSRQSPKNSAASPATNILDSGIASTGATTTVGGIQAHLSQKALPSSIGNPIQNQGALSASSEYLDYGGKPAGSNVLPYATQGSPFSNFTAFPEGNGTNGSGSSCAPQQTVTLPPVTLTLPAETVTVTASPQTMTITVSPQVQTQTVTVTVSVTITAGPAPPYPNNSGSPGRAQIASSPSAIGTGQGTVPALGASSAQGFVPSNAQGPSQAVPTLNEVGQSQGLDQEIASSGATPNASTAGLVPPGITGTSGQAGGPGASQLPNATEGVPITSSRSPQSFSIPPSLASGLDSIPIISPNPARPPPLTQVSSMSAASVLNNIPIISPNPARPPILTQLSSMSAASAAVQFTSGVAPPSSSSEEYPAPYQNASGGAVSAGSSGSGILPGLGPAPSGGADAGSGANGLSQFPGSLYQINGGIGNASVTAGSPAASSPPVNVNYTNTAPPVDTNPLTTVEPAPSTPPIPTTNVSNPQEPPLPPTDPQSACSGDNASTQHITADFTSLAPSTLTNPLLYKGLNFGSFVLTNTPSPNHLAAPASADLKAITAIPPSSGFSLYSLSLSCISDPPPTGNCTIIVTGIGGQGSSKGSLETKTFQLVGGETQTFAIEGWEGLNNVAFRAHDVEGQQMGVAVWGIEYAVPGVC
ncbi:hypothetical protein ACLMJK_000410 [Lecanora helva]